MTEWQLNHFLDLSELFAHTTDIVVADLVQVALFVLEK